MCNLGPPVAGPVVAVGTSFGVIQLWDAARQKCVRTMRTGEAERRVGALAWNAHILSSGNSSGVLRHHDVRVPRHEVGRVESAHAQVRSGACEVFNCVVTRAALCVCSKPESDARHWKGITERSSAALPSRADVRSEDKICVILEQRELSFSAADCYWGRWSGL